MIVTIEAPHLVRQLEFAAAREGLSADDYARRVLERQLAQQDLAQQEMAQQKSAASTSNADVTGAAAPEWNTAFDAWVDAHPRRAALPEYAFERASFYPPEASSHLRPEAA